MKLHFLLALVPGSKTGSLCNLTSEYFCFSIQPYYYNARTRETVWSRPENVKIISQQEVEAMAAAQNAANQTNTNQAPTGMAPNTSTGAQAAVAHGQWGLTSFMHIFYSVGSG